MASLLTAMDAGAKSRYFVAGTLIEAEAKAGSCVYVISAGLAYTAVQPCRGGRLPHLIKGPVRVAVDNDFLFFLDDDGKQHKAKIVKKSAPPPPPPVF